MPKSHRSSKASSSFAESLSRPATESRSYASFTRSLKYHSMAGSDEQSKVRLECRQTKMSGQYSRGHHLTRQHLIVQSSSLRVRMCGREPDTEMQARVGPAVSQMRLKGQGGSSLSIAEGKSSLRKGDDSRETHCVARGLSEYRVRKEGDL
eukprot:3610145-Prymnesium_polylepis.1